MGNWKAKKQQESQGKLNMPTTGQPNSNAIHQADFEDQDIPF
ncbi:hypothetical protein [Arsenophonus endosymbiont of Aleurodicus floccissimus]|nr:hypothetical protein [Arsenophonus endosymbiont of Aleurodicus floccissimus]